MSPAHPSSDVRRHILDAGHGLFAQRGFTAVGLSEILAAAAVPKGSFYHYFGSKDAFGEEVLEAYFEGYLARMDTMLAGDTPAPARLLVFFRDWLASQVGDEVRSRCVVVKLGAEVADLSEAMRAALDDGTTRTVARLRRCIEEGVAEGSIATPDAGALALRLYQTWLGASLLAKITREPAPLQVAMADTRALLGLGPRA